MFLDGLHRNYDDHPGHYQQGGHVHQQGGAGAYHVRLTLKVATKLVLGGHRGIIYGLLWDGSGGEGLLGRGAM